jgi:hypothetical protein
MNQHEDKKVMKISDGVIDKSTELKKCHRSNYSVSLIIFKQRNYLERCSKKV